MSQPLTFVTPPPGLEPQVHYLLEEVDGAVGLFSLVPREPGSGVSRLFLLDAGAYLPGYAPRISDEQQRMLGLREPSEAWVLVVANPALSGTTVNLLAPIVLNSSTGQCAQLILEGQDWPLRASLEDFAAA